MQSQIFGGPSHEAPQRTLLPGVHGIENRKAARPVTTGAQTRRIAVFDPINSRFVEGEAPALPPVTDSLNPYRRLDSRHRDSETIEFMHRREVSKDPQSFFKKQGEAQAYIEAAQRQSDMLVWQRSQRRDDANGPLNMALQVRPQSEVYDAFSRMELATTWRSATSPFLAHRHESAQLRRLRLEVEDPLLGAIAGGPGKSPKSSTQLLARRALEQSGQLLGGAGSKGFSKGFSFEASRASRAAVGSKKTHDMLLDFERKQHQKMNFQDWKKTELIELIEAQGLDVPGEIIWDNEAGQMKKEICKKQVYVDYCKRKLFEAEPRPLVRAGKRLRVRENYCIVDIFKAAHGAVRVQAYDDQDSREYQMLLIPNKMHEMDLELPPSSSDPHEWLAWSKLLIPRLELSDDGLLEVGDPPLQDNGLPAHFTLGASSSSLRNKRPQDGSGKGGGKGEAQSSAEAMEKTREKLRNLPPPDRMHVTLFFRSL
mmetsp:Transcript_6263/g.14386  ORF Transcript_6263/g.14386 Transcript_6263/m.14386 type:complete len:483 (+) Transcript_6263:58-1506(+)